MTDLFEQYETLPQEVKDIIDAFNEKENSYELCEDLINALEEVGYTCEYGLDAIPFNLECIEDFQILASDITSEDIENSVSNSFSGEKL